MLTPDKEKPNGDREAFVARLHFVLGHWQSTDRLARAAGISPSAFYKWPRGGAEPSRERLIAFADAAGVPIGWLVRGEGGQPALHKVAGLPVPAGAEAVARDHTLPRAYLVLPHRAEVAAAGAGNPEPDHAVEFIAFRHDWIRTAFDLQPQDVQLVTAIGDSMEPGIRHGDQGHRQTGQSGEGNFQWGGRPRPPAGASRRRIRARNMSPDGSLPPLAAGGRGRPPH